MDGIKTDAKTAVQILFLAAPNILWIRYNSAIFNRFKKYYVTREVVASRLLAKNFAFDIVTSGSGFCAFTQKHGPTLNSHLSFLWIDLFLQNVNLIIRKD